MSDTSVAAPSPAPASTPAPAPAANETPINTNPVASPTPVGGQAPDKAPADRAPSRREAIQAAFDRANKPQAPKAKAEAKPAPKPAEAKAGHNQPPEPTENEGMDLNKRPSDQPRGERGQFAPRSAPVSSGQPGQPAAKGMDGTQEKGSAPTLPEGSPYRDPPVRMAEHAKREWATAPESVRGEVHRMHAEFDQAYKQYRGDHETMNTIRPFHQMAAQHGTTLGAALKNYTTMEAKLRADPIGGLDLIVHNLNLVTSDGHRINLQDVAHHVLNQTPEQCELTQSKNVQQAANQQIGSLHQEIQGLKSTLQEWQTAQQFSYTRAQVEEYANARPRFDELGDLIENELKLGFDLDTAYRRAELLRPATHAAQTRHSPSAQTRPVDKSISGSPGVTGSNPAPRQKEKQVGRREAIQGAINRVRGIA